VKKRCLALYICMSSCNSCGYTVDTEQYTYLWYTYSGSAQRAISIGLYSGCYLFKAVPSSGWHIPIGLPYAFNFVHHTNQTRITRSKAQAWSFIDMHRSSTHTQPHICLCLSSRTQSHSQAPSDAEWGNTHASRSK